jgi:hypothetical protein
MRIHGMAATTLVTLLIATSLAPPAADAAYPAIHATDSVNVQVAPNLSDGVILQLVAGSPVPIRCALVALTIHGWLAASGSLTSCPGTPDAAWRP